MFHLIRAGAIYEIWAVRPPVREHRLRHEMAAAGAEVHRASTSPSLKHEYQVGSHARSSAPASRRYDFGNTSNGAFMLLELFKVPNLKQQIISGGYKKLHPSREGNPHRRRRRPRPPAREGLDPSRHQARQFPAARRQRRQADRLQPRAEAGRRPEQALRRQDESAGHAQLHVARANPRPVARRPRRRLQLRLHGPRVLLRQAAVHRQLARTSCCSATSRSKPQPLTVFDKNITPEFATYVQSHDGQGRRTTGPANMKDVMMEIKTQRIFYNTPQPPAPEGRSQSRQRRRNQLTRDTRSSERSQDEVS